MNTCCALQSDTSLCFVLFMHLWMLNRLLTLDFFFLLNFTAQSFERHRVREEKNGNALIWMSHMMLLRSDHKIHKPSLSPLNTHWKNLQTRPTQETLCLIRDFIIVMINKHICLSARLKDESTNCVTVCVSISWFYRWLHVRYTLKTDILCSVMWLENRGNATKTSLAVKKILPKWYAELSWYNIHIYNITCSLTFLLL